MSEAFPVILGLLVPLGLRAHRVTLAFRVCPLTPVILGLLVPLVLRAHRVTLAFRVCPVTLVCLGLPALLAPRALWGGTAYRLRRESRSARLC